jgi:hypothetical protein
MTKLTTRAFQKVVCPIVYWYEPPVQLWATTKFVDDEDGAMMRLKIRGEREKRKEEGKTYNLFSLTFLLPSVFWRQDEKDTQQPE